MRWRAEGNSQILIDALNTHRMETISCMLYEAVSGRGRQRDIYQVPIVSIDQQALL